jgi:hypothetical protein
VKGAHQMPNSNFLAFKYEGFGYMLEYFSYREGYVRPFSWSRTTWEDGMDGPVKGGDRAFTPDEVNLIKIWWKTDGYGGMTLEEFLEACK